MNSVLLKNHLIASRFSQELLEEENTSIFIRIFCAKALAIRSDEDQLDGHDRVRRMSHDPMTGPRSLVSSRPSDLDRIVTTRPRVSPQCAEIAIDLRPLDVHLRDRRLQFAHVLLMAIDWTRVHMINAPYVTRSYPTPIVLPRVLHI